MNKIIKFALIFVLFCSLGVIGSVVMHLFGLSERSVMVIGYGLSLSITQTCAKKFPKTEGSEETDDEEDSRLTPMATYFIVGGIAIFAAAMYFVMSDWYSNRHLRQLQASCPIEIEGLGVLTHLTNQNDTITFFYNIEEESSVDFVSKHPDETKERVYLHCAGQNDNLLEDSFEKISKSGKHLVYVYKHVNSGKTAKLVMDPDDYHQITEFRKNDKLRRSRLFDIELLVANERCPMTLVEGLEIVKYELDGEYVIIYYECSDVCYALARESLAEYDGHIEDSANSAELLEMRKLFYEVGVGNICRYYRKGNPNDYIDETYSPAEVKRYIESMNQW